MTAVVHDGHPPGVVLVTGATGGLGSAVCDTFESAGWQVAAVGHWRWPEDPAGRRLTLQCDVSQAPAVTSAVETVLATLGRIDALVCTAGVIEDVLLARLSDRAWDEVIGVNLRGAFLCCRAVLPGMVERRSGHILLVGSLSARGAAGQAHYAAAKAGLVGLGLSLAREVGPDGVCVNVVLPGVMKTGMTEGLGPRDWERFRSASVLGRTNTPEEVAPWMEALARSRSISGQVFALDGRVAPWA